jgi:hypothetical protein
MSLRESYYKIYNSSIKHGKVEDSYGKYYINISFKLRAIYVKHYCVLYDYINERRVIHGGYLSTII